MHEGEGDAVKTDGTEEAAATKQAVTADAPTPEAPAEIDASLSADEAAARREHLAPDDGGVPDEPLAIDETEAPDELLAIEGPGAADADKDAEPLAENAAAEVDERLVGILESVLFACGEPINLGRLMEVIAGPTRAELRAALAALAIRAEQDRRGVRLVEVAGGYQFRTAPEHAEWVRRLFQQRPWRLTRATLETLAIVAYKQPITRAEIEAIRGVDVDSVIASLLARKLVKIVGRKDVIGRPLLYGTTRQFLEVFGLRDLTALPGLSEVAGAMPESVAAGAAAGDENTWSGDDRQDEGHPPAEIAGGLGDVLAQGGGDADPERAGDRERDDGHGPGDAGTSD